MKTTEDFIQKYLDVDADFIESVREQMSKMRGFDFDNIPDLMKEYAKQLLEEYTNRIVENVKTKTEEEYLPKYGAYVYTQVIDKESITSQLQPFLKEIGL